MVAVAAPTGDVEIKVDFCRREGVAHETSLVRPRFLADRPLVFW